MERQLLPQGSPWAEGLQPDGDPASTLREVFSWRGKTRSLPYRKPCISREDPILVVKTHPAPKSLWFDGRERFMRSVSCILGPGWKAERLGRPGAGWRQSEQASWKELAGLEQSCRGTQLALQAGWESLGLAVCSCFHYS